MADLTAEWCLEQADECDVDAKWARNANQDAGADYAENLGHALRIAAAVLDERSVEGVASALREANGLYNPSGARAVLSYLRGEG